MKSARIYLRVSTDTQNLERQEQIALDARQAGYYIAGIYRETASGVDTNRPELNRLIADLQPGDVIIAEKLDRITRLPLEEAERLINSIRTRGARLAVPDVVDLSELASASTGINKTIIDAIQDMLLKIALQLTHDDYLVRRERQRQGIAQAKKAGKYKGRVADKKRQEQILTLKREGKTIKFIAELLNCSQSLVNKTWAAAGKK